MLGFFVALNRVAVTVCKIVSLVCNFCSRWVRPRHVQTVDRESCAPALLGVFADHRGLVASDRGDGFPVASQLVKDGRRGVARPTAPRRLTTPRVSPVICWRSASWRSATRRSGDGC